MNDTIKNVADKAQETTKATVAKIGEQTKVAMEKGKVQMADYADFQKGNVEAMAEAARIAAQGVEAMGQDAAAFAKKSFDATSEVLKAMAQVKSPTELMKLQADYFRTSFDMLVAEASRSTEASLKLAGDVAKPLQNRMALAAEKMKVAA
ncbi:phasin family protein [Sphingomonas sp. Leaf412]|uniref:phasin family protein n=1 Tax=Sphingomonas sp. Leaf412 TaxID=1736370 RepID=UPI00138F2304|nr:phasin family protein [Sphingomonas sp. Leaf412]